MHLPAYYWAGILRCHIAGLTVTIQGLDDGQASPLSGAPGSPRWYLYDRPLGRYGCGWVAPLTLATQQFENCGTVRMASARTGRSKKSTREGPPPTPPDEGLRDTAGDTAAEARVRIRVLVASAPAGSDSGSCARRCATRYPDAGREVGVRLPPPAPPVRKRSPRRRRRTASRGAPAS
jgi:hypothetical protein